MDYTKNYHLPQWKKEDRVMMEDFNQMCADMEAGLVKAQGTADAAYTPDFSPVAVGSYRGTGDTPLTIELGFHPRFVIVSGQAATAHDVNMQPVMLVGEGLMSKLITFQDTGFTVYQGRSISDNTIMYPKINTENQQYFYIAFR